MGQIYGNKTEVVKLPDKENSIIKQVERVEGEKVKESLASTLLSVMNISMFIILVIYKTDICATKREQ